MSNTSTDNCDDNMVEYIINIQRLLVRVDDKLDLIIKELKLDARRSEPPEHIPILCDGQFVDSADWGSYYTRGC